MNFIIIYTTFQHRRQARSSSKKLLKSNLIGCANIFKINSVYRWEGEIKESGEYGVFLKTTEENYKKVEEELKKYHPYELPCIISWKITGENKFLEWIKSECELKGTQ